jgi:hypothetical protein
MKGEFNKDTETLGGDQIAALKMKTILSQIKN